MSAEQAARQNIEQLPQAGWYVCDVASAEIHAAGRARGVARMHGTPICVVKDGKVVAIKP